MKVKKRALLLALALLLVCLLALPAAAQPAQALQVYDFAGLFEPEETEELNTRLLALSEQYGTTLYVITTEDTQGRSTQMFAEDSYDALAQTAEQDGGVFLIDMENRSIYLTVSAGAMAYYPDQEKDWILDACVERMSEEGAYACAEQFVAASEELYQNPPSATYLYDEDSGTYINLGGQKQRGLSVWDGLLAAVLAAVVAMLPCYQIVSKYKMKDQEAVEDSLLAYRKNSRFVYAQGSEPRLVRQFTNTRIIPRYRNRSGSGGMGGRGMGGSSFHSGSGGRSFSGGGRSF